MEKTRKKEEIFRTRQNVNRINKKKIRTKTKKGFSVAERRARNISDLFVFVVPTKTLSKRRKTCRFPISC